MQTNINKIRREVIRIYKSVDVRLKHVNKACSAGCSHCCHQNIPVHAAEEFAITEHVDKEFSDVQKSELIGRLRNWFQFMNDNTPNISALSEQDVRTARRNSSQDRRILEQFPFLPREKTSHCRQ